MTVSFVAVIYSVITVCSRLLLHTSQVCSEHHRDPFHTDAYTLLSVMKVAGKFNESFRNASNFFSQKECSCNKCRAIIENNLKEAFMKADANMSQLIYEEECENDRK